MSDNSKTYGPRKTYHGPPRSRNEDRVAVELNWTEMVLASMVAVRYHIDNIIHKRKPKHGESTDGVWDRLMEGACSECAVAKCYQQFWMGSLGDIKADDVGNGQVRWTPVYNGRLIIHKEDPPNKIFILVTGRAPNYSLRGWLPAHEAQHKEFWYPLQPNREAYNIDQEMLYPMATLDPRWIKTGRLER